MQADKCDVSHLRKTARKGLSNYSNISKFCIMFLQWLHYSAAVTKFQQPKKPWLTRLHVYIPVVTL